jgi:hypothetical protein
MELAELEGSDWQNAFCYANNLAPVLDDDALQSSFGIGDISEILAAEAGDNDGPDWIILMRLKDGRYAFLSAGCDYTGWDCVAIGNASVANDLQKLIRFGMGSGERRRLNLSLPEDDPCLSG